MSIRTLRAVVQVGTQVKVSRKTTYKSRNCVIHSEHSDVLVVWLVLVPVIVACSQ